MNNQPAVSTDSARPPTEALSTDFVNSVNLERALVDFDIANARVIDLTSRLTHLNAELLRARTELGLAELANNELAARNAAVEHELRELKSSAAYRAARMLGDMRAKAIRR